MTTLTQKDRENLSSYELGLKMGEQATAYLPTIIAGGITTPLSIPLTEEESRTYSNKESKWFESKDKTLFDELREYEKNLEDKYLPEKITIVFYKSFDTEAERFLKEEVFSFIKNREDFIRGFNDSLWDCDYSHYKATTEDSFKEYSYNCTKCPITLVKA